MPYEDDPERRSRAIIAAMNNLDVTPKYPEMLERALTTLDPVYISSLHKDDRPLFRMLRSGIIGEDRPEFARFRRHPGSLPYAGAATTRPTTTTTTTLPQQPIVPGGGWRGRGVNG